MRVVVTGGSGKAGSHIIPELLEHGHEILSVDTAAGDGSTPFMRADITDYGQTLSVLRGADWVIHMAAIPSPVSDPPEVVFSTNTISTWNVLQATEVLGINKLVLASSVNAMGLGFSRETVPPHYLPVNEEHPTRAEDSYSLSKLVGEEIADGFCRKSPMQIASFRFHGLRRDDELEEFKAGPEMDPLPGAKRLWGYLRLKDAARACRMALEADWEGHEVFFLNSSDTILGIPTEDAVAAAYPGVPLKKPLPGFQAAIDSSKAKRLFGWESTGSWRDI
jgi:nucleoside-diphosphate-sugar epimerase